MDLFCFSGVARFFFSLYFSYSLFLLFLQLMLKCLCSKSKCLHQASHENGFFFKKYSFHCIQSHSYFSIRQIPNQHNKEIHHKNASNLLRSKQFFWFISLPDCDSGCRMAGFKAHISGSPYLRSMAG